MKQKLRRIQLERRTIVKAEVEKLLTKGFIREVQYPKWLAKEMVVPKKNRKWSICIDYLDLNEACSKDSFLLLRID